MFEVVYLDVAKVRENEFVLVGDCDVLEHIIPLRNQLHKSL